MWIVMGAQQWTINDSKKRENTYALGDECVRVDEGVDSFGDVDPEAKEEKETWRAWREWTRVAREAEVLHAVK